MLGTSHFKNISKIWGKCVKKSQSVFQSWKKCQSVPQAQKSHKKCSQECINCDKFQNATKHSEYLKNND